MSERLSRSIAGREREQARLLACFDAMVDWRGTFALITGEAGIGKSTLAAWLASHATERGVTVLRGGCYDLSASAPYGPWQEVARDWRRRGHNNAPLHLPTSGGNEDHHRLADLYDVAIEFFTSIAADQPLLLVLEDLHWADDASLDLLRVVARETHRSRIMLLVTWRSNDIASRTTPEYLLPVIARESAAERIDLRPLDYSGIDALVRTLYALTPDDQQRLVDYLDRHAGGNPLFAVELLRELEDERVIVPTGAGWIVGDTSWLRLPPLLRQMIDARLSRLSADIHDQLVTAAVIGEHVPLELWRAVCGLDHETVVMTVEQAVEAHVLDVVPDGTSARFCHALIREVLYQSSLPPHRRRQHQQIAAILAGAPVHDPDAIAWHYQMAADERAAGWLIRSGERAQRAYAWTMAAERLETAVALLPEATPAAQRGWLAYRIGRLRRHADPAAAIDWLTEAARLGRRSGDDVLIAYASFDLGHARVLTGDYPRGLAAMTTADSLLENLPEGHVAPGSDIAAWLADTLPDDAANPANGVTQHQPRRGTLIQWLVEPGRLDEALKLGEPYVNELRDVLTLDEQTQSSLADAWFGLGRIYAARGEPSRAREALDTALSHYGTIGHHLLVATTERVLLAEVLLPYYTEDLRERRRATLSAARSWRRSTGALRQDFPDAFVTVEVAILEGGWQTARAALELAAQPDATIATQYERSCALLARLDREQGEPHRAWARVQAILPAGPASTPGEAGFARAIEAQLVAVDLALDDGDTLLAVEWLSALGRQIEWSGANRWTPAALLRHARLALQQGSPDTAQAYADEAARRAAKPRQPLELADAHRFLGEMAIRSGDHASALEQLTLALLLAEASSATYLRALTVLAIAEAHAAAGRRGDALRLRDEATAMLEPLGARPALRRATLIAEVENERPFGLSRRECEVLNLVAAGLTDAEIATQLSISYRTVTTHLTSIFGKLNVNSRVTATRLAVEHRLVSGQ